MPNQTTTQLEELAAIAEVISTSVNSNDINDGKLMQSGSKFLKFLGYGLSFGVGFTGGVINEVVKMATTEPNDSEPEGSESKKANLTPFTDVEKDSLRRNQSNTNGSEESGNLLYRDSETYHKPIGKFFETLSKNITLLVDAVNKELYKLLDSVKATFESISHDLGTRLSVPPDHFGTSERGPPGIKARISNFFSRFGKLRDFVVVTGSYWALMLTDGAVRMLIVLQFFLMGFSAYQIAFLFLFYEIFGVLTNLFGGWIGSKIGLRITLFSGLSIQIVALLMLAFMNPAWSVGFITAYIMVAQALAGIAKDLTKMSSKSSLKLIIPEEEQSSLFKWVSILTGSKNALKGLGFFIGGLLLTLFGFQLSAFIMAFGLMITLSTLFIVLPENMGKSKSVVKFSSMFSMSKKVNILSAARFFLFGARDVWFVVGLPLYLSAVMGWSPIFVAGYMSAWIIGYGIVQAITPRYLKRSSADAAPTAFTAQFWTFILAVIPVLISLGVATGIAPGLVVTIGLIIFGIVFAINSSVHSYLIVAYADKDKIAMNVGFYYMANAGGRLIGTMMSGLVYQYTGLIGCLWISSAFLLSAAYITTMLSSEEEKGEIRDEQPLLIEYTDPSLSGASYAS